MQLSVLYRHANLCEQSHTFKTDSATTPPNYQTLERILSAGMPSLSPLNMEILCLPTTANSTFKLDFYL